MNNIKKIISWLALCLFAALNSFNAKAEDTQRIVITSPLNGTAVLAGSTINMMVEAQPSHVISKLGITKPVPSFFTKSLFDDFPKVIYSSPDLVPPDAIQSDYVIVPNPPYSFTLKIRKDASIGEHSIRVGGNINGSFIQSEPVKIIVESSVDPLSLVSEFEALYLDYRGKKIPLTIYGNMPDGQQVYFDESRRLQCQSSDPAIVTTITPPCTVIAVGEGSATVTVTVGAVSTTVPVKVTLSIRGDFDGDGDVDSDDVGFVAYWRNTVPAPTGDDRDLNNDKKIDALDTRVLTTLCTRPRCATY